MGTDMTAFIEYDTEKKSFEWLAQRPDLPVVRQELPTPFSPESNVESLTWDGGLYTGSKDYLFFGAVAGIRNKTGIAPLYPPRGLPPTFSVPVSIAAKEGIFGELDGVGWLTLEEINAALDHQAVKRNHLSNQTMIILDIMEVLERHHGVNRVRLIFGFD